METGTDCADATEVGDHATDAARERTRGELRRGDTVDRYVVIDRVGAGAMGAVYAAFDPDLDRKVAIKLLHAERAVGDLLLREAQAMAKLDHPNAVAVHDVGETDGSIFVAMEFIHGVTLRRWLREQARSWRAIKGAFVQAGRGLAAAHAKGLVHRDFKPENVMVDLEGIDGEGGPARVRVLDFGLAHTPGAARSLPSDRPHVDRTDARVGTPAYMAPEQFMGVGVGPRTDQFAYCVALYEALAGARPFVGSNAAELAANVVSGTFAAEPPTRPIAGWLRRVVERGLAVDPELRWPSMDALLHELERDPSRRRRVFVVGALAVTTGVLALGVRHLDRSRRLAACDDAAIPTDAWNEALADEIGDTFARSGLGYATDAWTRARPRFAAFADAWASTGADVCRRETLGELAPAASDAVRACLDDAATRMAAVTDRLRNGSATAIEQAISWAAGLPKPELCADDREIARRMAAARDPAIEEPSADLRRELFAIDVLIQEQSDDALARADSVRARAEGLGSVPLLARSRIAWASAAITRGSDALAARAELETAFDEATIAGDDAVALSAALSLAYLLARELEQPREALIWCRIGKNLAERLGLAPDAPDATGLESAIGMAHFAIGETPEAEQAFARVVEVWRATFGSGHPKLSAGLSNLGAVAVARGRLVEGIALYEEALALAEAAFGPDHPDVAHMLQGLAMAHARAADFESAERALRRALAIRIATGGADAPATLAVQANLAPTLLSLGKHDDARQMLEHLVTAYRERNDASRHGLAGALHNLGNVYLEQQRFADAKRVLTEAVELRTAAGSNRVETARSQSRLAKAHVLAGDVERARASFDEAITTLEQLGGHEPLLRDVLVSLGEASLRWSDAQGAASACARALALSRAMPVESRGSEAAMCSAVVLWNQGGDRAEVTALVREARVRYVADGYDEETAAIDAWLAKPTTPPPWKHID